MHIALTGRWGQRMMARPQHVPHSTPSPTSPPPVRAPMGQPRWMAAWKLFAPPAWGLNTPLGLSRDTSWVSVHFAFPDFLVSVCGRACRFGAYKSSSSSSRGGEPDGRCRSELLHIGLLVWRFRSEQYY